MGSGTWDADTYDRMTRSKVNSGDTFSYTRDALASGRIEAHESLRVVGADGEPEIRESRDGADHPDSTPIVIGFDVTGSMGDNPGLIQKSLKQLMGMLVRRDVVSDPQIAIAAYGDAECDSVPLQVSQFESDNRIDEALDNVFIEQGGGGNDGETSALLAYYISRNVRTDSWEKRHRRGYVFLIGDECSLDLTADELEKFTGVKQTGDVSAAEAFSDLLEQWNVYFLLIDNWSAERQESAAKYGRLLKQPQHVIRIDDGSLAAAAIAGVIGSVEGTLDAGTVGSELVAAGFDAATADGAVAATADLYGNKGDGAVAPVDDSYGDLGL